MEALVKLITPYLGSEVDNAAKNKSRQHNDQRITAEVKSNVADTTDAPFLVAQERRKNEDRRKKKLARGRWFESRMKQDRRKENQLNTKI